MSDHHEDVVVLRREILALKDNIIALGPKIALIDLEAAASLTRARAALFEAWTIIVGPPEENDEDH